MHNPLKNLLDNMDAFLNEHDGDQCHLLTREDHDLSTAINEPFGFNLQNPSLNGHSTMKPRVGSSFPVAGAANPMSLDNMLTSTTPLKISNSNYLRDTAKSALSDTNQ